MRQKFVEAVGRHFRFLETEFRFVLKSTKPPLVIFESDKLQVLILYDETRGHELDLGLRRLADAPRKPLSLGIEMLVKFKGGRDAEGLPSYPSTVETLEIELARLATLLRKYGSSVLKGDLRDFDRLEQAEEELAKQFGPSNEDDTSTSKAE